MEAFEELQSQLEKHSRIALTAPGGADGDSVGTQCALYEFILKHYPHKKVFVINEEPCPKRYLYLKHSDAFFTAKDFLTTKEENPTLWICVDGGPNRLGPLCLELWNKTHTRAQMDHHKMGSSEGVDCPVNNTDAASTTQILYNFFKFTKKDLSPTIAQALYTGLIYDTGLFKHPNTTVEVMQMGTELLAFDFNHTRTAEHALLMRTPTTLKLMQLMLSESSFEEQGSLCWARLNYKELQELGASPEDKEGLIDLLFLTPDCQIAALFSEFEKGIWKVSFRSRGPNVAQLAQKLDPQGGGHILAAGCTIEGSFDQFWPQNRALIIAAMQEVSP